MNTIILLFGGPSRERLVSTASAQNLARFLPGQNLKCWFWSPEGAVGEVELSDLLKHKDAFTERLNARPQRQWSSLDEAMDHAATLPCIIFNALHGLQGEDGFIQELCETRKIALTGSQAAASRLSFDKGKTRQAVAQQGIKIAPALIIKANELAWPELQSFLAQQKKIVIKPLCDGSSFGLAIISDEQQLISWKDSLRGLPTISYIAEKFIAGIELTAGVAEMQNGLRSLPTVEIAAETNRIFDYEGKYLGQGVREIIPARVSPEIEQQAQAIALKVHQIVGLRGYSRTDLIAAPDGDLYFLEVNSLPGLSAQSLIPQELAAVGISMAEFVEQQLRLSISKI